MTRSLTVRILAGFVLITIIGALLASLLARWMTAREFNQLVVERAQADFVELVSAYYEAHGSWEGVLRAVRQAPSPPLPRDPRPREAAEAPPVSFIFLLADQEGVVLVPGRPYRIGERLPAEVLARGQPVEAQGQVVGTVIATGAPPALDPREQNYLERTDRALLISTAGAAVVALILGVLLSRGLTGPLRALTRAARALGKGDLGQQVPVRSEDEVGQLAQAFNQMSVDLARAVESRRQMTADIAHDLRTPLTVLGGYLESMQDGVLEPSPERLETMNAEIQGLIRLVEDLRTLSLVDAGELDLDPHPVDPKALLERAAAAFAQRAEEQDIELETQAPEDVPAVHVDPARMHQVLGNLLANALRYTPSGGRVSLSALGEGDRVLLQVRDDGLGIDPEILPYLFERFYRGEKSRTGDHGETGLGLAIARSIVQAHGGDLTAESLGRGQGSTFTISLPIEP